MSYSHGGRMLTMGYEVKMMRGDGVSDPASENVYSLVSVDGGDYASRDEAMRAIQEAVEAEHAGLRPGQWRAWLRTAR